MTAQQREPSRPERLEDEIPKNNGLLALWLAVSALAVAMLVLMILGFVDASIMSPGETSPDIAPGEVRD